jgi:MFS family permease
MFSPSERRSIIIYIIGIMFYKFGLEAFNGSIIAMATVLFDREADLAGRKRNTFYQTGVLTGLNQATQCIGAILVAPLVKRYPTRTILSGAVILYVWFHPSHSASADTSMNSFGLLSAILLIVDGATGGKFKPKG